MLATSPWSPELDQLRATIRRFVEDELAPHARAWEEAGWFADWVLPRMGELGFLGLSYPTEYGGQGGDYWSTVVLAEELPRCGSGSLPMAVGVQTDMATPPILRFGTEAQRRRYLTPAIRGEKVAAIGISEPEAGSDISGIRTRARRDGDGWVIDGAKLYVTNGVRADFVTMVVRTTERDRDDPWGGISLFLVDTDLAGVEVTGPLDKVGMRASDTALIHLSAVRVPDDALLGVLDEGFKQTMWQLQGERLFGAIAAIAGAQLTFDRALAYARQREAFGRPIARFQAVKHRLADMATAIEGTRALVYETCDAWNRGTAEAERIAMCKLAAGQVAFEVADAALQIHGGHGYCRELDVERAWRDARLARIGGGSDEVQREIIAKLMGL